MHMFKRYLKKGASFFGRIFHDNYFRKITEDKYSTYGISYVLHKKSIDESAEWIKQFICEALFFNKKSALRNYAIECLQHKKTFTDEYLFLEFGVATGTSINQFASAIKSEFYGFDTFEGMPEDWKGWNVKKGQFPNNGKFPKVADNVNLIKGLIEKTLPSFLEQHKNKKIAFIHIDTDSYAPAKTILSLCKNRLVPGSIILFDELHSYTSWQMHEYKALKEELADDSYKFIAFSEYKQGMIQIVK